MQTELEYTAILPESLYEPLIWDSEEASVQILNLNESRWDYTCHNRDYYFGIAHSINNTII